MLRLAGFAFSFLLLPALGSAQQAPQGGMQNHMDMTTLRPAKPGDSLRGADIVAAAKKVMERYTDYHKALADGYTIFLPDEPQPVYHFTLGSSAMTAEFQFDATKPTSLLYEKKAGGYKLVGVMYTAPFRATPSELDARVPLSVAQWHLHTNLCMPPRRNGKDLTSADSEFGFEGSIHTAEACQAAGGRFMPHVFGWMVHCYALETDPAKIWEAGMDDDHGMQHGAGKAMPGMKM